jgi:predicted metal-dependent phosphoesterase TrpH
LEKIIHMKCDLHVHSWHSGLCDTPVLSRFCRESYSDPEQLHSLLRRRGMDLVTITDHDSIEGATRLLRYSDVFVSEELTCRMPSGTTVHIGVYDLTERQHEQIQRRRNDLLALLIYLTERRLFFSINHVFSCLTGPREREDFAWFENYFPAVETRNGQMLDAQNRRAAHLARLWSKAEIGGSDAHTWASAGRTYTEVRGARTKEEFLEGLRAGRGRVGGEAGGYAKLTRDLLLIAAEAMREKWWTALLGPLTLAVPLATLLNYAREMAFSRIWARRVFEERQGRHRPFRFGMPESVLGEEA